MAFRELNPQHKLTGFYARIKNNNLQGIVTKYVAKADGPFFVIKLTASCKVNQKSEDGKRFSLVAAKAGEWVGLGATTTLSALKEYPGKEVRVQWTGETPSQKFKGKSVQLFKVEVNDEAALDSSLIQ
jgi:hypothetical protein